MGAPDESLGFEVTKVLVDGGQRRETEVFADFSQRWCIPVLVDVILEIVDHLFLSFGQGRHRSCLPSDTHAPTTARFKQRDAIKPLTFWRKSGEDTIPYALSTSIALRGHR